MFRRNETARHPLGFKLLHRLRGHKGQIHQIAWSPDGQVLASSSDDGTIRLWDMKTGRTKRVFNVGKDPVFSLAWSPSGEVLASGSYDGAIRLWHSTSGTLQGILLGHADPIRSLSWSPDERILASGSDDYTVRFWDPSTGELVDVLRGHASHVTSIAWSPNGQRIASASDDKTVRLWDSSGQTEQILEGHSGFVLAVSWASDGVTLASGSSDRTICLWDTIAGTRTRVIEGHTSSVRCVLFLSGNQLLASKSLDNTVRLWNTCTWESVAVLNEPTLLPNWYTCLACHPASPTLATLDEYDEAVRVWELSLERLLATTTAVPSAQYVNAKVILVGDTGVGKTGLALVLTGQPFRPTESTHGRHVWVLNRQETPSRPDQQEIREILLWDVAGQPGYRLIHQLHLNEVSLAVITIDARSEIDPLAGIHYWIRALRQATRTQRSPVSSAKMLLVAARVDRGGLAISASRMAKLVRDLGFEQYFETSAKEQWGIKELLRAIQDSINWQSLPKVVSTRLFQQIRTFLIGEKGEGRLLCSMDDLYRTFRKTTEASYGDADLSAEFETCIGSLESQGLIQKLSFGNLVLLQPELLDAYASAIVDAARDEPDGLGCILEESVLAGGFRMSQNERVSNKAEERLLLIAAVEEMLRYEIALREQTAAGPVLIFPSQLTREWPEAPAPEGQTVVFRFEGPLTNAYATLIVRLSRTGFFVKEETWKDATIYSSAAGGLCGVWKREIEEGKGEFVLFYNSRSSEETRFLFEDHICAHLQRWALPETFSRHRIFACPKCGEVVTERQADRRRERGFLSINCPVCDAEVSLLDGKERLGAELPSAMPNLNREANDARDRDMASITLAGKRATNDFDLFISYSEEDAEWVHNWLLPSLEKKGIYAYTRANFEVGVPILDNIELAVEGCRKTLLVMTPSWVEREWSAFETLLLQTTDPTGLRRRLLPLLLKECNRPRHISIFEYANFTQPDRHEYELQRIIDAIHDRRALSRPGEHNLPETHYS